MPSPAGHTRNGLPNNRFGRGPRTAVVFQGLLFENKPLGGLDARFALGLYRGLEPEYTVYVVTRRKGLPSGCTLAHMSADYAEMIAEEFDRPVDVIGTSTGGSLALQFGAEHGELARKLVIHSSAYKLGPVGKELQLRIRDLVREGQWRKANATLMGFILKPSWYRDALGAAASVLMTMGAPDDPSDLIVTIEAEDAFDFHDRLAEIGVPTLVIAGAADIGYTEELFRETARGISGAQLVLYPDMRHPARGARFGRDLRAFLLGTERA